MALCMMPSAVKYKPGLQQWHTHCTICVPQVLRICHCVGPLRMRCGDAENMPTRVHNLTKDMGGTLLLKVFNFSTAATTSVKAAVCYADQFPP
eukprot:1371831-Amorphochlora_amoeboformis.AAC.1